MEIVRLYNATFYRYGMFNLEIFVNLEANLYLYYTYMYMYFPFLFFESQLARDCKYLSTTVKFEIGMEIFTATGHSLLSPGYTSILTWQTLGGSDTLPKFTSDEKVNIQEVKDTLRCIYLLISSISLAIS